MYDTVRLGNGLIYIKTKALGHEIAQNRSPNIGLTVGLQVSFESFRLLFQGRLVGTRIRVPG